MMCTYGQNTADEDQNTSASRLRIDRGAGVLNSTSERQVLF